VARTPVLAAVLVEDSVQQSRLLPEVLALQIGLLQPDICHCRRGTNPSHADYTADADAECRPLNMGRWH